MEIQMDKETLELVFQAIAAQIPDSEGDMDEERQYQLLSQIEEQVADSELKEFVRWAIIHNGDTFEAIYYLSELVRAYSLREMEGHEANFVSALLSFIGDLRSGNTAFKPVLKVITGPLTEKAPAHLLAMQAAADCADDQPLSVLTQLILAIRFKCLPPEDPYQG